MFKAHGRSCFFLASVHGTVIFGAWINSHPGAKSVAEDQSSVAHTAGNDENDGLIRTTQFGKSPISFCLLQKMAPLVAWPACLGFLVMYHLTHSRKNSCSLCAHLHWSRDRHVLLCFLIFFITLHFTLCTHVLANMLRSENNLFKLVLLFYHVGPRESTSGHKAWQRVLSLAELSQQPLVFLEWLSYIAQAGYNSKSWCLSFQVLILQLHAVTSSQICSFREHLILGSSQNIFKKFKQNCTCLIVQNNYR